jgi:hypothetical protein
MLKEELKKRSKEAEANGKSQCIVTSPHKSHPSPGSFQAGRLIPATVKLPTEVCAVNLWVKVTKCTNSKGSKYSAVKINIERIRGWLICGNEYSGCCPGINHLSSYL